MVTIQCTSHCLEFSVHAKHTLLQQHEPCFRFWVVYPSANPIVTRTISFHVRRFPFQFLHVGRSDSSQFSVSVAKTHRITREDAKDEKWSSKSSSSQVETPFKRVWRRSIVSKEKGSSHNDNDMEVPTLGFGFHDIRHEDVAVFGVGPDSSSRQCNVVLKQLEKKNENDMMVLFQWMRANGKLNENRIAYNLAFRVLSTRGDWDYAEFLLHEMTTVFGCVLNAQIFNTLLYACYDKGLADQAIKWFRKMLECNVQPTQATFGMVMNLYQKSANVEEAEFAFAHMRKTNSCCCSAYSSMTTIYTRLGLYEKAEGVMRNMKEDGFLPNMKNWLVQMNVFSQQGKLEEAEEALQLMQRAGFMPNVVAYNTLITGYGKASDIDGAERIFKKLLDSQLEPDETTFRSMVEGCGRAGRYKEALWYYNELKRSGFLPNASNLFTMILLQAKHEDDAGIIQTLKDMRSVGCQYSSIVSSLLQAYKKVGRLSNVPFILKSSFYDKLAMDQTSCSIVVLAYIQLGMVDDVLEVMRDKRWADRSFEDNLYHLLICSCKESGCYENAVKIYTQMPKSPANPNLHITCSMIDIYSAMGLFENAEDLYSELKSSGCEMDMVAYSVVIRMYVKAKLYRKTSVVLDIMEKQKNVEPDSVLFLDMLRIYKQCDMPEKLSLLYYRILKSGVPWDGTMYNCVINCCGHALPVDELSKLYDEMIESGFTPNTITFNVMIHIYGKAGLFKKARKVLAKARKLHLADVITFNTIIAAYGKEKDLKKMKFTVKLMQYAGFEVSLEAYNTMLDTYGKKNLFEEFNETLEKMKEACCASDHYTYNIMINIYGRKGWIEEVADVLDELKESGLKPNLQSYNTLIKVYGIAGMVEEAVDLVKEIRRNGFEPDRITYATLISILQKNDQILEAIKWSLWMKQMGLASTTH